MPGPAIRQQVQRRLHELYERHLPLEAGSVATYYGSGRGYSEAELSDVERGRFAIALAGLDGEVHCVGAHSEPFALQSLSKVFAYSLALDDHGRDRVLEHVGVEPSGDTFNSIVFDEHNNRPYNPMVNAGALVTTDLVRGRDTAEKLERLLALMRVYAGNDSLDRELGDVRA